jgi:hypothetical protein
MERNELEGADPRLSRDLIHLELHAAAVAGLDAGHGARIGDQPIDHPRAQHEQHDDQREDGEVLLHAPTVLGGVGARPVRRGGAAGERRRRLDRPGEMAPGRRTSEGDDGHAFGQRGLRRRDLARRPSSAQAVGPWQCWTACGMHGSARRAGFIGARRWP